MKRSRSLPALSLLFVTALMTATANASEGAESHPSACETKLLNVISQDEATLMLQVRRSMAFGLTLFTKNVGGRDRLLIVVSEDMYKSKKQIAVGKQFLAQNQRQVFGDAANLVAVPGQQTYHVGQTLMHYAPPVQFLFGLHKRRVSLAEGNSVDVEEGWQPSIYGNAGFGLMTSKLYATWLAAVSSTVVLGDLLSSLLFGPEYSLGLLDRSAAGLTSHIPGYAEFKELRKAHPVTFAVVIGGVTYAAGKFRQLRQYMPHYAFKYERAEHIVRKVDAFWVEDEEQDQAVLFIANMNSAMIHWYLTGYERVPHSDLIEVSDPTQPVQARRKAGKWLEKYRRFRDRFSPPEG